MRLFDKVKGAINDAKSAINDAKDQIAQQVAQKQEEEKRRQEEEKRKQEEEQRRQEEANRFNPDGKSLQWFGSEDGIKAFGEYITVQNYLFEERIKKEYESNYSEYDFDIYIRVVHKDAKIPYVYFKKLADTLNVQALKSHTCTTRILIDVLSTQAKPFWIDEDGEPKPSTPAFTPEEIVSTDKNPTLNFVKNFDCFEIKDDAQGSWQDKYMLWSDILIWIGTHGDSDKDIISQNPWIFSKEVYLNEFGMLKKRKAFCKKCIELATTEQHKAYFEKQYNQCE